MVMNALSRSTSWILGYQHSGVLVVPTLDETEDSQARAFAEQVVDVSAFHGSKLVAQCISSGIAKFNTACDRKVEDSGYAVGNPAHDGMRFPIPFLGFSTNLNLCRSLLRLN
jgi:hypothetical protein